MKRVRKEGYYLFKLKWVRGKKKKEKWDEMRDVSFEKGSM